MARWRHFWVIQSGIQELLQILQMAGEISVPLVNALDFEFQFLVENDLPG